ncbi:YebC/PmpR family DNA-binding transcriptional regulator, partial [Paenibacillus sepulcri]|nr:YebC/PmpR family DNA-binding transcriptional regulator [Paenibacillus sepulcri]
AADVRSIFNKRGGNMGESGCVAYMFDQKGLIVIDREQNDTDEDTMIMMALEGGAEDVIVNDDSYEILTDPQEFERVKGALEHDGYGFSSAAVRWLPQNTIKAEGENAEKLLKMMDAFEDNEDVQDVFANFEIDEDE